MSSMQSHQWYALVMRSLYALLIALALLVVVTPQATFAQPSAPTQIPHALRILAAGDSITKGQAGPTPAAPYPEEEWVGYRKPLADLLTAAGYRATFVGSQMNGCATFSQCRHEGHGGWTIAMIDQHIAEWMAAERPDVITLHVGTVDLEPASGADPATAPARLEALLAHIQALDPSVGVVFTTIPPIGIDAAMMYQPAYNVAMPGIAARRLAAGQRIVFVDPKVSWDGLYDTIHPSNEVGYPTIGQAMFEGIQALPSSVDENVSLTLLPSAVRSGIQSSVIENRYWRSAIVWLNVTMIPGSGQGLTVRIIASDPVTGTDLYSLMNGPPVTAVGPTMYTIQPGAMSDAVTRNLVFPRQVSVYVLPSGGGSWTYSLGASLGR